MKGWLMVSRTCLVVLLGLGAVVLLCESTTAVELESSYLEREGHRVRFGSAVTAGAVAGPALTGLAQTDSFDSFDNEAMPRKSPLKALVLSAAIPGAGQFYLGGRIKPLLFFGAEIAAWGLHFKWQGAADDATDFFEQFNYDHWSRQAYKDYLGEVYGDTVDTRINAPGVTHHLPTTDTQQFFEMTGKYNQFAWGWDDATRHGESLEERILAGSLEAITIDTLTPNSARRIHYEGLRHDANQKYDKARNMVMVSILNRLVSGFEAYFSAKNRNRNVSAQKSSFSRISMRASLESYQTKRDTPFVNLAYRF